MAKIITIEALLAWVYREELPKAQCDGAALPAMMGGFDPVASWVGDGMPESVSDGRLNAYGLMPDRYASAEPHPDAIAVFEAVQWLEYCALDMPEGWNPFADMPAAMAAGGWGERSAAEALRRLVARPGILIRKHALLGGCPDWGQGAAVPVERKLMERGQVKWFRQIEVKDSLGLPMTIEVDGRDRIRRRPYPGAYTKTEVVPDPVPLAVRRAEYQLWRASLDLVLVEVEGVLIDHDVQPSAAPWDPWCGQSAEASAGARILPVAGWAGDLSLRPRITAGPRGPRWSGENIKKNARYSAF